MKIAVFAIGVLVVGLSGCQSRLPRVGMHQEGVLWDASIVGYSDTLGADVPFRVYPMFIDGVSKHLTFAVEIDGPMTELFEVGLFSGDVKAPTLVVPLARNVDARGMVTVTFETDRSYEPDLWLTFVLAGRAEKEKGVRYILELKSWPILLVDGSKLRREEWWPGHEPRRAPSSVPEAGTER